MNSWISINRVILENPIVCKDSDYFSVWVYLLLEATHTSLKREFKGTTIELKRGQLLTGRKKIAKQFNISESKVQRILKRFESEHQIEQQTSNKNRLVTIKNYDKYQKVNNKTTSTEQQVNTYNNVNKEINNIKGVVDYLNKKINSKHKHTTNETIKIIKARYNEGFKFNEFITVIDNAYNHWSNNGEDYSSMKPSTLFNGKFESRLDNSSYGWSNKVEKEKTIQEIYDEEFKK